MVNGLFTLPNTNSDTNSDSDSKSNGYIVLCRTGSHCMDSDSDAHPDSHRQSLLYPFMGQTSIPGLGSESVSGNVNKPLFVKEMQELDYIYCFLESGRT